MTKYDNTRIVKIKEDFNLSKNQKENKPGRLLYKKGSEHAIHYKLLKKLDEKGLKYEILDVDFKALEDKARLALRKHRKADK